MPKKLPDQGCAHVLTSSGADRCSCRAVIRRVDELDNVHCPQHGAYAEIDRLRAENERLKVEYDEATQALATELADERTLTNRLRTERDRLREASST